MKKFETLWQELMKEFPEMINHTEEMKEFLQKFIAAKPTAKFNKNFKEELEEKIKFEIEILKKNQTLVKNSTTKNYKSWFKYAGMAFGGLVVGVMVAPFFQSPQTQDLQLKHTSFQNFDADVAPKMARMKSNQDVPMAAMIQESNFAPESDMADMQLNGLADEAPEFENINSLAQPLLKPFIESKKSTKEFMQIDAPMFENDAEIKNTKISIPVFKNEPFTSQNNKNSKIIGCGAEIVWQSRSIPKTTNVLEKNLMFLLNHKPETQQVRNTISRSNLKFENVAIEDNMAKIYLTGNFGIGHCAIPEIKAQIEKTAFQFESIQKIEVYMNDEIFDWCDISDADSTESGCDKIPQPWKEFKQ